MEKNVRYRVRPHDKSWADAGPDLLRQEENAMERLRAIVRGSKGGYVEFAAEDDSGNRSTWTRTTRRELVDAFVGLPAAKKRKFVVRTETGVIAVVRREDVPLYDAPGASRQVDLVRSLAKYQFPGVVWGGGYVWKQTYPGYWSDHAWGDAGDLTQNVSQGAPNDLVFDWLVRMARNRCIKVAYIIGSRNGRVVSASAPDFDVTPGGGSDSHLWHVHYSVIDHGGAMPPKQGGKD